MFARVVSAQASPGRINNTTGLHNLGEALAENAAMQPGIRGFLGLVDRSTGRVMTVTLWATPQDLESSESSGYLRRQMARAEALLGGPITCETFEVVAHCDIAEEYQLG